MEVYCHCGTRAKILTSWTDFNLGRRFWTCVNQRYSCGFFVWFDPPMCPRSIQIIPGLLQRIRDYEAMRGNGGKERREGTNWKVLWVLLVLAWMILAWVVLFGKLDEESKVELGSNTLALP